MFEFSSEIKNSLINWKSMMRKWATRHTPLVFKLAKRRHWWDASSWLAYTLFGGLIPFWGTALILLFVGKAQPLVAYLDKGELAVFCAGLVAAAIPVMRQRIKDAPIDHPGWFHFFALLILAVVFILFASVTLARQFDASQLNTGAVVIFSVVLFLSSITMGFFVELIRNVRVTNDEVVAINQQREESLQDAFMAAQRDSMISDD